MKRAAQPSAPCASGADVLDAKPEGHHVIGLPRLRALHASLLQEGRGADAAALLETLDELVFRRRRPHGKEVARLRAASAGHFEAYATIVDEKKQLSDTIDDLRISLRGAHDLIHRLHKNGGRLA